VEDEVKYVRSYWITFRKRRILERERGSTRSHSVENSGEKKILRRR
jgi:hypothetical protein